MRRRAHAVPLLTLSRPAPAPPRPGRSLLAAPSSCRQYFYADVHKMNAAVCTYPSYIDAGSPVLPYYIPFRALTVDGAPNMLVAGKLMATSFFANAAMRLHPEEWASGEGAGVAAALMVANKWGTTLIAYENIAVVQQALLERGAPLNWTI